MNYPDGMDAECIPLCDALNALPGIRTFESCCGHDVRPHWIFFTAKKIENLRPILVAASSGGWSVNVMWANGGDAIYFLLEGPIGPPDLPGGANDFASWLSSS